MKHHTKKQALLSVNLAFGKSVERAEKRTSGKDRRSSMHCHFVPLVNDWTRSVNLTALPGLVTKVALIIQT